MGLLDHVDDGGVEVGPQYVHVEHAQEAHDSQHVARFDATHPRYWVDLIFIIYLHTMFCF